MAGTLIIGYGNPSRRDDGVGLAVVNGVRERLGLPPLADGDDGSGDLGSDLDALYALQLTPELVDAVAGYDRLVLADAHTGIYAETVHVERVLPGAGPGLVSHVLRPERFLALAQQMNGSAPETALYSVRGSDFNFGEELSPEAASGVRSVVEEIWRRAHRQSADK